jgi:hypothetical protein
MIMGSVTTFWASYEGSLRYRRVFGGSFGLEGGLGYVRDQMQFNVSEGQDLALVPDAIYSSFKISAKALYISGPLEAYLAGENRIVSGGGAITTRFDTAKASGFRLALGATYNMGKLFARVEGALMHYAWTFSYDGVNDVEQADGATDSVRFISLHAGYRY